MDDDVAAIPPARPRRIAAGAYHNVVCSNIKYRKGGDDAGQKGDGDTLADPGAAEKELEESVWGFGSNRNHQLGWYKPQHEDEQKQLEEEAEIRENSDKPLKLRIDGGSIFEVCCGGSHTIILQKKGEQLGGQVWSLGLGTCGRLGIQRPQKMKDEEAGAIMRGTAPLTMEGLLRDSWLPETAHDYANKLLQRGSEDGRGEGETSEGPARASCLYTHEILQHSIIKKWSLRDPVKVVFPDDMKIARIACGVDHTLAITTMGSIYAWGLGSYGNLGTGRTDDEWNPAKVLMPDFSVAVQVAAGMKHSMALCQDCTMFSWGHGGNGRLGHGDRRFQGEKTSSAQLNPRPIEVTSGSPGSKGMIWIAAGESHSASIDDLGNVYTWGTGSYGRTGHGEGIDEPYPKVVSSLTSNPCTEIALGVMHSLALTKKGTLYSWGTGCATGVMANGGSTVDTPVEVRSDVHSEEQAIYQSKIIEIACGSFHSMALSYSGELFVWGVDSEGRLGCGGSSETAEVPYPIRIMSNSTVALPPPWSTNQEDKKTG
jgi:alpha-tubulin suppressor-like RCC1 family protein